MMSESDDEPLSALAAIKHQNPDEFMNVFPVQNADKPSVKKVKKRKKKSEIFESIPKVVKNNRTTNILVRPDDAWLYLKEFKPTGPYSCLLCPEWFINRSKMVIHYIVNHQKDFCGICRYFVPDREAWLKHTKIHQPHPCPKCINIYETELELAYHLALVHQLTHCPLCHFMVSTIEFKSHLSTKHLVKSQEYGSEGVQNNLCEFMENKTKFICQLCGKVNNTHNYFNHFGCFHRITLKCFSQLLSGFDYNFNVSGAQLSSEFMEKVLGKVKYGYINVYNPEFVADIHPELTIKQESFEHSNENEKMGEEYEGTEDIDMTSVEVIPILDYYSDYIEKSINDVNIYQVKSYLDYNELEREFETTCPICNFKVESIIDLFRHWVILHSVQMKSIYNCRVCMWGFNTKEELMSHVKDEIAEFDDLWLCQFCDKEFDGREATREHLADHLDVIEVDNCFSPHLGFKCKFCPTLFWNEVEREGHEKNIHYSEHAKECYRCELCGDMFSDLLFFIHHLKRKHIEDTKGSNFIYKCLLCCSIQKDIDNMRVHFFCSHPEAVKTYCTLEECRYKPIEKKNFKVHLRLVHKKVPNTSDMLKCNLCTEEFDGKRAMSTHMAQVHGRGKFFCKICKQQLQTNDERKLHYLLNHPGHHPFECTVCHKSFLYKSSLYSHRTEHTMAPTFKCEYCAKTFAKKDSYREHLLIHAGPTHSCSYCPMVFVQRSNMLRHERRHTGERPYSCDICGRTFSDKGACTSHYRTHTNTETYQCVYCGQRFVQKSKLKYHIRKHTGENLETCTVCSKTFTSACSLREHMKTHIPSDVAVKCPECNKQYRDERTMLRHLRTAHNNANLPCPLCDKRLNNITNLKHHVLTHSKNNMFYCKFCTKSYACRRSMNRHIMKRHSSLLEGDKPIINNHYRRLDVRELNLGLDEATLTRLFGPVTSGTSNFGTGTSDDEIQPIDHVNIKMEQYSDEDDTSNNGELEPTDFVSVKIEPIDEDRVGQE